MFAQEVVFNNFTIYPYFEISVDLNLNPKSPSASLFTFPGLGEQIKDRPFDRMEPRNRTELLYQIKIIN